MRHALFEQRDQTTGVTMWVRGFRQHGIVASHFTLHRQPALDPPHGGMEEKDSAYDFLYEISPVISAPQMREFMQQNDVEIFGRQFAQRPSRQNNGRLAKTNGGRHPHFLRRGDRY